MDLCEKRNSTSRDPPGIAAALSSSTLPSKLQLIIAIFSFARRSHSIILRPNNQESKRATMNVPLRSHSTDALAAQLSRVALAASASTGARAVRQRAVAAASSSRGFSSSSSPASSSTSSSSFQKAGNARTWSAQKCGHGLVPSSRSEVGNGRSRHVGARRK